MLLPGPHAGMSVRAQAGAKACSALGEMSYPNGVTLLGEGNSHLAFGSFGQILKGRRAPAGGRHQKLHRGGSCHAPHPSVLGKQRVGPNLLHKPSLKKQRSADEQSMHKTWELLPGVKIKVKGLDFSIVPHFMHKDLLQRSLLLNPGKPSRMQHGIGGTSHIQAVRFRYQAVP